MASVPPVITGLFTERNLLTFESMDVGPWCKVMCSNPNTPNCRVLNAGYYYKRCQGVQHEFLRWNVKSIVIAERSGRNFLRAPVSGHPHCYPAHPADTTTAIDTVAGHSVLLEAAAPPLPLPETAVVADTSVDIVGDSTASRVNQFYDTANQKMKQTVQSSVQTSKSFRPATCP
ncbi:hypothetical protein EDC04DRAFT_2607570 [Pisolithus marmoratus]|nr:hypothetical protein EDC04DRAFT_2607570 [Pisolithus marmoratus]